MQRKKLTAEVLRRAGACASRLDLLEKEWPRGTYVTRRVCLRAGELGADFGWAVSNLLSASAREAYDKATASAREAYDKARASAWEAYDKATALAFWRAWRQDEKQRK